MTSQTGSGKGFVPSGNKAFTGAHVDPVVCRHMASQGHNELMITVVRGAHIVDIS